MFPGPVRGERRGEGGGGVGIKSFMVPHVSRAETRCRGFRRSAVSELLKCFGPVFTASQALQGHSQPTPALSSTRPSLPNFGWRFSLSSAIDEVFSFSHSFAMFALCASLCCTDVSLWCGSRYTDGACLPLGTGAASKARSAGGSEVDITSNG